MKNKRGGTGLPQNGVDKGTKRLQERNKGVGELRYEGDYFLQDAKSAHVL